MEKKSNVGLKLILAGIILFGVCILVSFFWYQIFKDDKKIITNLTIALKDSGKGINVNGLVPETDVEGIKVDPYSFDIINNGEVEGEYEVLIQDGLVKDKDGYMNDQLLTREQLRYQLVLNGKIIEQNYLSTVKNNVLDSRIVDKGRTNSYELRIWLPQEVQNTKWQDKNYHYEVVVNPVNREA